MISLGITSGLHDTAAAIVKGGRILAASEEERFNRTKHSSEFPLDAIQFCIREAKIRDINDIDEIAVSMRWKERGDARFKMRSSLADIELIKIAAKLRQIDNDHEADVKRILQEEFGYKNPIIFLDHHDCHAASCYFTSGFSSSAIVVIDGAGEVASTRIYEAERKEIRKLFQIDYPNSLGGFYGAITDYLGFRTYFDEGKIMALAAFGNDNLVNKMRSIMKVISDSAYSLDLNYFDFPKCSGAGVSKKFIKLFGPKRLPDEEITQQHKDVARATQRVFEECFISIIKLAKKVTGTEKLCMGGGAVLNSVANGKVIDSGIFKNVYIYPAAGDDGTSIGAALLSYYSKNNSFVFYEDNQNPFIGYQSTEQEILTAIKNNNLKYIISNNICRDVAHLLAGNKIVAWFSGRAEFGPRALGNRSIFADPRNSEIKDIINNKIKKRESFRPFAPIVLEEHAEEYFDLKGNKYPYMIVAINTKNEKRKIIPAVIHIDGTARIQTINKQYNERIWNLINDFYIITGVPLILNTSFNRKGEPIINKADEAIECFLESGIDALVLENYIIKK